MIMKLHIITVVLFLTPISSNATLTFSRLVILTNICFLSICVHYDAEIECAVIDMMQLKNLERAFMTVPRMGL